MAPKWTEEQKKVIELHNRNILVSAAAGSGKTAVLVQRIADMVSDESKGIDIDRLLIVTYTNAAAFEMKERILAAIEERMRREPENMHLRRQQSLINHAQITTIDSFCLNIIRNYFSQTDMDPGFKVVDEGEEKLMFSDVMDEMIEDFYQEGREEFYEFVECFTPEKTDASLGEYILNLYKAAMSHPWPKEWLDEAQRIYETEDVGEFLESDIIKETKTFLSHILDSAYALIKQAQDISSNIGGPYMYIDALNDDESFIDSLRSLDDPFECASRINDHKYARLSSKKDESVDEDAREQVKMLRDMVKDSLAKTSKIYQGQSLTSAYELVKKCAPLINIYVEMTSEFIDRISMYKRKKNVIDFVDMEHLALNILVKKENGTLLRTDVAKELAGRFEEILIDEYQDSNLVQEIILNSISREADKTPNIFMVGDVKQSIYRFRLARPELFVEKYNKYTEEDSLYRKIELHNNFRSRREVLESVNQVFEKIMRKEFGGISYDDNARLYYKAGFLPVCEVNGDSDEVTSEYGHKSEVYLIEYDGDSEDTAIETEAKFCADKIKELVNNPKYSCLDKESGKYRKLKYSDIVVLMRSLGKNADTFVNIFANFGIPAVSQSGKGYFDSYEVAIILDFLNVTDNPRQDIALAAVLKSYFGMFTGNELAVIKTQNPKKSLYDAFMLYQGTDDIADKIIMEKKSKFLGLLDFYRNVSQYKTIHELIWDIIYNTGYYAYVGTMPLGTNRQANLDMLVEKAKAYEKTSFHGLFNFVRYIERLKSYDVDYDRASLNGENDDVVRIMTIHKSKGLEFPVVFLSNAHRGFNNSDANQKIVLDADFGIGIDFLDSQSRVCSPTIVKKTIAQKIRLDGLSEEQRILYVALTRAKEKLYISGIVKDAGKNMAKWSCQAQRGELTYTDIVSSGNYLDMIMPAAAASDCGFDVIVVKPEHISKISERMVGDNLKIKEEILMHENIEDDGSTFVYPYKTVEHPMKMTVSELKHLGQYYDDENHAMPELDDETKNQPTVPSFISQKEEVSGASRGSAYHKIMELIDYEKCTDEKSVSDFISECAECNKITQSMADSIEAGDILKFINAPVGQEMKKAFLNGKLFRERQFVMGIPAAEVDKQYDTDEMILIQGVIDAYYETDEGLVLLDYKTDNVPYGKRGEEELTEKYKKQLDYYERALNQLTGMNVIKKSIYSFKLGKEIVV